MYCPLRIDTVDEIRHPYKIYDTKTVGTYQSQRVIRQFLWYQYCVIKNDKWSDFLHKPKLYHKTMTYCREIALFREGCCSLGQDLYLGFAGSRIGRNV